MEKPTAGGAPGFGEAFCIGMREKQDLPKWRWVITATTFSRHFS